MVFPTISEAQALAEAMSGIYPTSQILLGQITGEDYIRNLALHFYEELVCDYRLEPNCLNAVMALASFLVSISVLLNSSANSFGLVK